MDKEDKAGVTIITALCIAIVLAIFATIINLLGLVQPTDNYDAGYEEGYIKGYFDKPKNYGTIKMERSNNEKTTK